MIASLTPMAFSDRQTRERAYYDEYAKRTARREISFAGVVGSEQRPFNPYWRALALVRDAFRSADQRLLDFGCGPGDYSVMCAAVGYDVFGFDISRENVRAAQELAAKYETQHRTHFSEGVAEHVDYPDEFFDVVLGIDILHHVAIEPAIRECWRVLKSGGFAIFKEPVEALLFEPLRNSRLGRWIVPKEPSFECHITADERKLNPADLAVIRNVFHHMTVEHFRLLSRVDRFLDGAAFNSKGASRLEIWDRWLLEHARFLRPCAGAVVMQLRREA